MTVTKGKGRSGKEACPDLYAGASARHTALGAGSGGSRANLRTHTWVQGRAEKAAGNTKKNVDSFIQHYVLIPFGLLQWLSGKQPTCKAGEMRRSFHTWVGMMPWRREGQLTPVFLENPVDRGAWSP